MKVAALVCLAVCVVAASALPKKVEVAVYKSVLTDMKRGYIQLKEQKSDCADCLISLTETVANCILHTDTTEGIIKCVEDAIGTADACFPCICDVLAYFDVICEAKH